MTLSFASLRDAGFGGLRVVGDVHGDSAAFDAAIQGAAAQRLFVLQLGDLTDYGPDAPGALRRVYALLDSGAGCFLLGNHDHKLRRALRGARIRSPHDAIPRTLQQLHDAPDGTALAERAIHEIARAPAWLRLGPWVFVHAAFHRIMLISPPPEDAGARKPDPVISRALFGLVTGRMGQDGYPERLINWVDSIPSGITVHCGHDVRSRDGRPLRLQGRSGGEALFLDTGAGKGGHLSWIDLLWP